MRQKYNNILLLHTIALVLACICAMPASAGDGKSCASPIELTPGYQETIWKAGTVWYVANTFDLPMAIDFYPSSVTAEAPELYLDFSCTPGVYDDPIICGLFCAEGTYLSMPYRQVPTLSYDDQGKARYHVAFGQFYRDMLLSQGIDYNVPVYIRVVFSCGGELGMEPDAFNNCMDGPKFMHLGDTVQVQAKDKERHVIVPYIQWKYDSIRYVWHGEKECHLAVGNKCDFDPLGTDATIIDRGTIQDGGAFKVSSELLRQYVSDQKNYPNEAGMYFAKFYSEAPGVMKIEQIPAPAPGGGATLLKYGTKTKVNRDDTDALYAIPSSWVEAMQFTTPTDHVFKMYIGATPSFTLDEAFAVYQFDKTENGHVLSLFDEDMEAIWKHKLSGENYLYIRFECTDNTTILPSLWTPSACMKKASRIVMGEQFSVGKKSTIVYSLYFEEIKGGDMTVAWTSVQSPCLFLIADTCNVPNIAVAPVFYSETAPKQGSYTVPQATVDSWASHVDPDGYLYIRFYSQGAAKITVSTTAPEETDPPCSTVDSIQNVTAWDSYDWRGTTYTESGSYTRDGNIDPETECMDTLFTLNLTIHKTSFDALELTECDSMLFNEKKYTESGEYVDTVFIVGGDRIITTLTLTIHYSSVSDTTATECGGFEWHGEWYEESGDYAITLTNEAGCDSVRTLHLTVYPQPENTDTMATAWDSIAWYGTMYTADGDYSIAKKDENGCDYLHTLHLTVLHTLYDTVRQTACDSLEVEETIYRESALILLDTTELESKDRQVNYMDLTILHTSYAELNENVFDSYTAPWGDEYTESGDYADTTTNVAGCDSITTLHLTIHTTLLDTLRESGCDSVDIDGVRYKQSGEYADTTLLENGDRVARTIYLTIGHSTYQEESVTGCEEYISELGNVYTESGTYEEKTINDEGCDAFITLHVTIITDCTLRYDTAYYCRGFNTEHEEQVEEFLVRRYIPYAFESPADIWEELMDGVELANESTRTLMDLNRAEANIRGYYIGGLTPVETIGWSTRNVGAGMYVPVVVTSEPQWIPAGMLAVQIHFRCGEIYNTEFPMAIEQVEAAQAPAKRIENGQMIILRGDAVYTPLGQRIK